MNKKSEKLLRLTGHDAANDRAVMSLIGANLSPRTEPLHYSDHNRRQNTDGCE